jgi:hypothetical protein
MLKKVVCSGILACALVLSGHSAAQAQTADVTLRFGNSHTFWVEGEPQLQLVPNTTVYYVPGTDYDMYRYGNYYYVNNGYSWYRSTTVGGPYVQVATPKVPQQIVVVPTTYRHYEVKGKGKDPWMTKWKVKTTTKTTK